MRLQARHLVDDLLQVVGEHALGDLELEPARVGTRAAQGGDHLVHKIGLPELVHADIDRQRQRLRQWLRGPPGQLGAGRLQHPLPQWQDQTGLLRHGNELARADSAAPGVGPAQQSLGTNHLVTGSDLGLVVQPELAGREALAYVGLQRGPRVHRRLHGGIEKPERVAPGGLGLVHRHVGALENFLHAAGIDAEQRDPDAGAAAVLAPRDIVGLTQQAQDFFRHGLGVRRGGGRGITHVVDHHHEFVATQPRDGVRVAHKGAEPPRHLLQQQVPLVVAHGVVEGLEVVQVDQQQRAVVAAAAGGQQRMLEPVLQQAPVGQVGQRVVKRQPPDLPFVGLATGDVARHDDETRLAARLNRLARHRQLEPALAVPERDGILLALRVTLRMGAAQGRHHHVGGRLRQHLEHGLADQAEGRLGQQVFDRRTAAVITAVQAQLEDRIADRVQRRLELVLGRQDFCRARHHLRFETRLVIPLVGQQLGQVSQQQAGQQTGGRPEPGAGRGAPAVDRCHVQVPGAVGNLQALAHRLHQRLRRRGRYRLLLATVGLQPPQFIVVAPGHQLGQRRALQQVRQPHRHVGETPEPAGARAVLQEHRQPAHHTHTPLRQIERAGQRQPPGVARETSLAPLPRIVELVEADQLFIARARHHALHYAIGRHRQGQQARIGRQQLCRRDIEIAEIAIALAHQRRQRVIGRHHALHTALQHL